MRHLYLLFYITLILVISHSVIAQDASGSIAQNREQMKKVLESGTSQETVSKDVANTSGLTEAVAQAAVWANYWFGYWDPKLPGLIQAGRELDAWPRSVNNNSEVYVFVDQLHATFDCALNQRYMCAMLWDFDASRGSVPPDFEEYGAEKRRYSVGSQRLRIRLSPRVLQGVTFGVFDARKTQQVQELFEKHILNQEFYSNVQQLRSAQFSGKPIRIRVGNFNPETDWIYFYVEGERYLGIVELTANGNRFVHLDGGNLDSPPYMWSYPNVIKRINENGAWFVVSKGKLVKE